MINPQSQFSISILCAIGLEFSFGQDFAGASSKPTQKSSLYIFFDIWALGSENIKITFTQHKY